MTLNSTEETEVHLLETWHSRKERKLMKTEESVEGLLRLRTGLYTLVSGILVSEMVLEVRCGQTVQGMKAIGNLIKPTVKAS